MKLSEKKRNIVWKKIFLAWLVRNQTNDTFHKISKPAKKKLDTTNSVVKNMNKPSILDLIDLIEIGSKRNRMCICEIVVNDSFGYFGGWISLESQRSHTMTIEFFEKSCN